MSDTGCVRVARFELRVGDTGGTLVRELVSSANGEPPRELVAALKRERRSRRGSMPEAALEQVERAEDKADEATTAVEQADALFKTLVEGEVTPGVLSGDLDGILSIVQRLDKQGKLKDEIRVGRAVSRPLAIAQRWLNLVDSLKSVVGAAERSGDRSNIAWASHELGTLHMCAGQQEDASQLLDRARKIRAELGDEAGLAVTEHNLQILCRLVGNLIRERRLRRPSDLIRSPVVLVLIALLLGAGAAAGAVIAGGSSTHLITVTATQPHHPIVALRFATAAPPTGTVGQSYSFNYAASRGPGIRYAINAGSAPPGLSLTSGGHLFGTPTTPGSFSYTVTASATNGATASRQDTVSISPRQAPKITFSSGPPPPGTVGNAYRFAIVATGDPSISDVVTVGALPPGLSLSPTGLITGTATTQGTFTFTVTATGSGGGRASQKETMTIDPQPAATITFAPASPPPGTSGVAYSFQYSASGDSGIAYASQGSLPLGLTLSRDGLLSGTPTQPGTYTFTVIATGASGGSAMRQDAITIAPPQIQ